MERSYQDSIESRGVGCACGDFDGRAMHAVRRSILERLLQRLGNMQFGFTYIERGPGGVISNTALKPFASLADCCAAAENVLGAQTGEPIERIEVVPCQYDGSRCEPQIMSVIRSFRRSAE